MSSYCASSQMNRDKSLFTLSVLFQTFILFALFAVVLLGDPAAMEPVVVSRVGLCVTVVCAFQLASGGLLKPPFLLFVTFALFSFGVPLILAVDPSYSDWYLQQIDGETFSYFSWYTVLCIQAYCLGLVLAQSYQGGSRNKDGVISRFSAYLEEHREDVAFVSQFIFTIFGIVSFAYAIKFMGVSLESGINSARLEVQNSALVNLSRGMFVPAGFMSLVYSEHRSRKRFVLSVLFLYAALTSLSGDRTEGLTLLVAVFVFWYQHMGRLGSANLLKKVVAILSCIAIVLLIPAIASFRVGGVFELNGILNAVEDVFSELGFNFYTVCFQSSLNLPTYHGLTYLASLTSLLPSSFDFLNLGEIAHGYYGEMLYNQAMVVHYPWASFGLGYSLVAESFLNFGVYGFITIVLFGYIVGKLCGQDMEGSFNCYLSFSFLWAFLTVARRGFEFPVNSIEYILVFLPVLIFIFVKVREHFTKRN